MMQRVLAICAACLTVASWTGIASQAVSDIQAIESAMAQTVDRGAARFLLAQRYARAGNSARALALLEQVVRLDEGFDPRSVPAFQPLTSAPGFEVLAERVRRRYPPVHHAQVAFTIDEPDLFPEGIAADPDRHIFYVGSMHHRKIVRLSVTGEVHDFVKADRYGLAPVGGIRVDPDDHTVWAATDSAEFVHVDENGALIERFATSDEGPHILNDLVVRNRREIYLTDTRANRVYRFDRGSHTFNAVALHRRLFAPNGITLAEEGNVLYVADSLGVIRFDLRTNVARDVDPGRANTLAGIDGLYFYENSLVAVQYGTGAFRVVRCRLSRDGRHVTSTEVIERGTPLVASPTTGAIVGRQFYFIANTGIPNLENDEIIDPQKLEPVHIAVASLD
jgi:sugar lactone lactonase YvrE